MNLFDGVVVIISLVEQITSSGSGKSAVSAFRTVRILRTFRVLRVTKLLRALSFMKIIIGVISRSLQKFIYIAMLLFILIFIYSLLGMQIFSGQFNFPNNPYRESFDGFFWSFLSVFQIMTVENWNDVLYLAMHSGANTFISLLYLVSWIFIGNYIFLNLFLAILLDEFSSAETEKDQKELNHELEDDNDNEDNEIYDPQKRSKDTSSMDLQSSKAGAPSSTGIHDTKGLDDLSSNKLLEDEIDEQKKPKQAVDLFADVECEKAVMFFSKENFFRRFSIRIVKHDQFENFIIAIIFLSSIKLAIDTYFIDASGTIAEILADIDIVFNVLFLVECILKVVAFGFIMDGGSYLRETWNILDFWIVVASSIDMVLVDVNLPFIKVRLLPRETIES